MHTPPPIPNEQRKPRRILRFVLILALLPIAAILILYTSFRITNGNACRRLEAKARASGQPLNLKELAATLPDVPDSENAALPLLDLWTEEQPEFWNAFRNNIRPMPDRKEPVVDPLVPFLGSEAQAISRVGRLPEESHAAALAYVKASERHLQKVRQAIQKPHFRFPLDISQGFAMLMPHLPQLRTEARNFRVAGLVALEKGDTKGALQAMEDTASVGQLLREEPLLLSQLVRLACLSILLDDAQRLLSRQQLTDDQLARLETLFRQIELKGALQNALISERASSLSVFDSPTRAAQLANQADLSPESLNADNFKAVMRVLSGLGLKAPDKRLMLETFEQGIALSHEDNPGQLRALEELFPHAASQATRFPPKIFSGLLLPPLSKAATRFASFEARRRAGLMAIAVERYRNAHQGRLPEAIAEALQPAREALTDPFDGQPLRFAKLGKQAGGTPSGVGYVVYSVGQDRADDHGKERPPKGSTGNFDDAFIVER